MKESSINFCFINKEPKKNSGKRVAIVGSGPAGLSAAGYIATAGHSVVVYEALSTAGGLMSYAIPEYRIPVEHVQSGVEVLRERFGVHFEFATKIVGDSDVPSVTDPIVRHHVTLGSLRREFDAVLIATGSWRRRYVGLDNEDLEGVYSGIEYLYRIRAQQYNDTVSLLSMRGEEVVVIGAGFTAIDVATRALEQGAKKVTIAYRKTITEAPAGSYEIHHLMSQGVEWKEYHTPIAVEGTTRVEGIVCEHTKTKDTLHIPCSVLVTAIGDSVSLPMADVCDAIVAEKEDPYALMQRERLYIAGDAWHGATKIGYAVTSGLKTAQMVLRQFEYGMSSCFYSMEALRR